MERKISELEEELKVNIFYNYLLKDKQFRIIESAYIHTFSVISNQTNYYFIHKLIVDFLFHSILFLVRDYCLILLSKLLLISG